MPNLHPLEQKLAREWPPATWRDVTVMLAVSGGGDSVALLRSALAIRGGGRGQLVVAHFNHHLRGPESDEDAAFVSDLCRQLDLPCELGHSECIDRASDDGPSDSRSAHPTDVSEEDAREARYGFLRQTAKRIGARIVATAHTADDQAETVMHRILRGTGIAGLAGIRRTRELIPGVSIIRPLLAFHRSEAVQYLQAIGQPFREDSTNRDIRFTRNRIRLELLPQIVEQYNTNAVEALTRLASIAEDAQTVIDGLVANLTGQCIENVSKYEVKINCRQLGSTSPYMVREILISIWRDRGWPQQAMSYDKWDELARLTKGGQAVDDRRKKIFPGGICAERTGDLLLLLAERAEDEGTGAELSSKSPDIAGSTQPRV